MQTPISREDQERIDNLAGYFVMSARNGVTSDIQAMSEAITHVVSFRLEIIRKRTEPREEH
jgi:hypothetical protein